MSGGPHVEGECPGVDQRFVPGLASVPALPARSLGLVAVIQEPEQIGSVTTLHERFGALPKFIIVKEPQPPGYLLGGADLQTLAVLGGPDEV
jgi:hypothetical protein